MRLTEAHLIVIIQECVISLSPSGRDIALLTIAIPEWTSKFVQ